MDVLSSMHQQQVLYVLQISFLLQVRRNLHFARLKHNLTFAAALAVILANGLVFHDVDSIIYGLIFNFLSSYIINRMMFGFNACMMALIVTSDGPAVCRMIGEKVDRGSTILKGYGGYSQDGRDVVLCACSSKQLYIINRETKRIDPGSFIVMLQANEVEGEGFKRLELGEQS